MSCIRFPICPLRNDSRLTVRAADAVVLALAWSGWRTTGVETVVGWAAVGLSGQA